MRVVLIVVLLAMTTTEAGAQQAPPMRLTSPAFADSATVPSKYACTADPPPAVSPALAWTNVPPATASLALIVHDVERQRNNRGFPDFLHWIVWNIPPSSAGLPEAVPAIAELPDGSRQMTFAGRGGAMSAGYRNLCTPAADAPHHFIFELFALDVKLELPPTAARADVERAIDGHIIGHAVLVGRFAR